MTELAINHYICPEGYGVQRFLDEMAALGVKAVGLTRSALEEVPPTTLRRLLDERDLAVTSLNSAGYFTFVDASRRARQADLNLRLIDAAAELQAHTLCVITGGMAECASVDHARVQIEDGLARLDEGARAAGVQLGLEPIHPAGLLEKGCINSIAQAREVVAPLSSTGLILDLNHSWWDTDLIPMIRDAGERVRLIQICNVSLNGDGLQRRTTDLQEGMIRVAEFLRAARQAGYAGPFEFEIFARDHDGTATETLIANAIRHFDGFS